MFSLLSIERTSIKICDFCRISKHTKKKKKEGGGGKPLEGNDSEKIIKGKRGGIMEL